MKYFMCVTRTLLISIAIIFSIRQASLSGEGRIDIRTYLTIVPQLPLTSVIAPEFSLILSDITLSSDER